MTERAKGQWHNIPKPLTYQFAIAITTRAPTIHLHLLPFDKARLKPKSASAIRITIVDSQRNTQADKHLDT